MENLQPTQAQVAPAPASPAEVPGIPATPAEGEMSQEQMKANLQDLMSKIDNKYQDFNVQKFSSDNKVKDSNAAALRMFFDMLQQNGVDPSNVEEVGAFLEKIKANNPEVFKQIESILQTLIGGDTTSTEGVVTPDAGAGVPPVAGAEVPPNMNINTNEPPQQNI